MHLRNLQLWYAIDLSKQKQDGEVKQSIKNKNKTTTTSSSKHGKSKYIKINLMHTVQGCFYF